MPAESYAQLAARYRQNGDLRTAFAMMCHPDSPLMQAHRERIKRDAVVNEAHRQREATIRHALTPKRTPALSDHYPAMDGDPCDANGIAGNCGAATCSAYAAGKCPIADEVSDAR